MRYMCLIYGNEAREEVQTEAERSEMMQGYMAFSQEVREAGVFEAGDPLMPTETATTLRTDGGSIVNIDGPFAETKEQLGGYYILDCENLDQALAFAAKIPGVKNGSIEVRPIMVFPGDDG